MQQAEMQNNKNGFFYLSLTFIILVIWYVSTSACNIFSKYAISTAKPVEIWDCAAIILTLSMIQLVIGVLFGAFATRRISSPCDLYRFHLSSLFYLFPPLSTTPIFLTLSHGILFMSL